MMKLEILIADTESGQNSNQRRQRYEAEKYPRPKENDQLLLV